MHSHKRKKARSDRASASIKAPPKQKKKQGNDSSLKQFVSLNWLDIVAEEDASKEFVDARTPTELLAKKLHSTGYVYKEDDYAIVLCRDEDESNLSYLALPKCVITERKDLFRAESCAIPSAPIMKMGGRKKTKRKQKRPGA